MFWELWREQTGGYWSRQGADLGESLGKGQVKAGLRQHEAESPGHPSPGWEPLLGFPCLSAVGRLSPVLSTLVLLAGWFTLQVKLSLDHLLEGTVTMLLVE